MQSIFNQALWPPASGTHRSWLSSRSLATKLTSSLISTTCTGEWIINAHTLTHICMQTNSHTTKFRHTYEDVIFQVLKSLPNLLLGRPKRVEVSQHGVTVVFMDLPEVSSSLSGQDVLQTLDSSLPHLNTDTKTHGTTTKHDSMSRHTHYMKTI